HIRHGAPPTLTCVDPGQRSVGTRDFQPGASPNPSLRQPNPLRQELRVLSLTLGLAVRDAVCTNVQARAPELRHRSPIALASHGNRLFYRAICARVAASAAEEDRSDTGRLLDPSDSLAGLRLDEAPATERWPL